MPDDPYARDIHAWAEHQAALLRRVAAGERVNELDWPHIIEEIEDVGSSARRAVRSLLRRAMEHLMKLAGWPDSPARTHWRSEARGFLVDAADAYTPSMRQEIDLAGLYRTALLDVLDLEIDGARVCWLPPDNPFTIAELATETPDIDALTQRLRS